MAGCFLWFLTYLYYSIYTLLLIFKIEKLVAISHYLVINYKYLHLVSGFYFYYKNSAFLCMFIIGSKKGAEQLIS